MTRITVRFPRSVIIVFGWLVFASCVAVTAGIGCAIAYLVGMLWPAVWAQW